MFLRSNRLEQVEFKLEKILGDRNMQEKLEKDNGQGKKEKTKQTWLKITQDGGGKKTWKRP